MQSEHRKSGLNDHMGNVLHTEHINDGGKRAKYRRILSDIGIEKPEGEPLTEDELRLIFIYVQEGLCT